MMKRIFLRRVMQLIAVAGLLLLTHSSQPGYSQSHKTAAPISLLPTVSNSSYLRTCRVTNPRGSRLYVRDTGRSIRLRNGTSLSVVDGRQHQGLIVVRVRQGKRSITGSIDIGDTNC